MVKRGSERQITKDDCDEEEASVQAGVFGKASEAQMNRRRIVKVKRHAANNDSTSGPNPFAGVALTASATPPQQPIAQPDIEAKEATVPHEEAPQAAPETEAPAATDETPSTGPTPSTKADEPNSGSGFAAFANSTSAFKKLVSGTTAFGAAGSFGGAAMSWPTPGEKSLLSGETKQVSPTPARSRKVTGEEEEETLFNHSVTLFALVGKQWKTRGKGDLRVNTSKKSGGRLIMRQKGTLRLLLNAGIFEGITVSKMGQDAVTFSCVNGADESVATKEGEDTNAKGTAENDNLQVYALRFLVKGEGGEILVNQFEKAIDECRKNATEKKDQ